MSQYKNAGVRRFGTAARMQMKIPRDSPGPGAYRPPSDFGYLEIIKSPRTSQSPRQSLSGSNFFQQRMKT